MESLNFKKRKIVLVINNPNSVGGPTTSMGRIKTSNLSNKYTFEEVFITEKLGKVPKVSVILRLIKEFKQINPDVIHVSGLQLHGCYAVLAARLAGNKNVLLVVRGTSTDDILFGKLKKNIFFYIIEPLTIFLSKKYYIVSNNLAKYKPLIRFERKSAGVIHNSAPKFKEVCSKQLEETRKSLHLKSDDFILIYTGRVVYDKGIKYVLDALRNIDDNNIKLLILGDGSELENLQTNYKDLIELGKVNFVGVKSDINKYLMISDIFVFPTLHENLSNSLLEAGVYGLPSIVTNVGGNIEVVKHGYNGLLVPPYDSDSFKNSIIKLRDDEKMRMKMAVNAKRNVELRFNQNSLMKKLDKVYEEIYEN